MPLRTAARIIAGVGRSSRTASISSSENIDTASSISARFRMRLGAQVLGDLFRAADLAVHAVEVVRLHLDEIDDAFELPFQPDRDLHQDGVVLQLVAELLGDAVRVRALAVGLVDERDARDVVPAHLAVDRHRLRLHAGDGAQHEDGAVEDAQRALDLDREIDVSRRVDDVDVVPVPLAVRRGGLDRDAALALQVHRVHLGADAVLALDVVDDPDPLRVEEDALGERRLPGVDVRADADVADAVINRW